MTTAPNPGSREALDAGCVCAVLDNGHGSGSGWRNEDGSPAFWITEGCPVHPPGASVAAVSAVRAGTEPRP